MEEQNRPNPNAQTPTDPEEKLISLQKLAEMTGVSYRSILQARTEGRFLLPVRRPSPGLIRVLYSDALAVQRGEKQVMGATPFSDAQRQRLDAHQKAKTAAKKKGGAR